MSVIATTIRKHALVRLFLAIVLSVAMAFLIGTGLHGNQSSPTALDQSVPAAAAKASTGQSDSASNITLSKALQTLKSSHNAAANAANAAPVAANAGSAASAAGQSQPAQSNGQSVTAPMSGQIGR